jgi:hypothetical protein
MAQQAAASGRCAPAWPKDALRIGFGVIWLTDAVPAMARERRRAVERVEANIWVSFRVARHAGWRAD